MIKLGALAQSPILVFWIGIGVVLSGCAGSLPYDLARMASMETLVYQTGLCNRLSVEQFHRFVSSFETNSKTLELRNVDTRESRKLRVRRVLAAAGKRVTRETTAQQSRGETLTFLPGIEECRLARFHLLVEVQDSLAPCLLEVVQAAQEIADDLSECGPLSIRETVGNIVVCSRLRVCDLRLEQHRLGNLMTEFPRVGNRIHTEKSASASSGAEQPQELSAMTVEAKGGMSLELEKLLDESAHTLLKSFSYAVDMPPSNLFRALYPLPALEMIPSPTATLRELVRWLEDNAYSRIQNTSDLRFGDVLVGFHFDQREIGDDQETQVLSDLVNHFESSGLDHLGVYLGRGLVAVSSPRRCGMTVVPILPKYAAAYRIVPGYAVAEYRLPIATIDEYANSCAGYFLLGKDEGYDG